MTPSATDIAHGQTIAERKLDVDRLEAILQGMIVMLHDNPDIPVPWSVDISCDLSEPAYDRFLERHGLTPFRTAAKMAYLAPIAEKYTAAEDRNGFYLPWTIATRPEDQPL